MGFVRHQDRAAGAYPTQTLSTQLICRGTANRVKGIDWTAW